MALRLLHNAEVELRDQDLARMVRQAQAVASLTL